MDWIEKLGTQVPALTVLVILVTIFLKHVSRVDSSFSELMKQLQADSLEARKRSQEVIDLNTKVLAENNTIGSQQTKAIERLTDVLTRNFFNLRTKSRE